MTIEWNAEHTAFTFNGSEHPADRFPALLHGLDQASHLCANADDWLRIITDAMKKPADLGGLSRI